mgnify:CR=1 FL=1
MRCRSLFLGGDPLAENRCANAHHGGSLGDRSLQITAHSHGELFEAVPRRRRTPLTLGFLQLALQLGQPRLHRDELDAYVKHVATTLIPD